MTEDEMVEWHHQLNGHEFEQALGNGEGQGSLVCCSPRGRKGSDTTEPLNNNREPTRASESFSFLSESFFKPVIFHLSDPTPIFSFYYRSSYNFLYSEMNLIDYIIY